MEEDMIDRRKNVLTDEDLNAITDYLLKDDNIDKFAEKFEERFAKRFYSGLGKGLWGFAWKGVVMIAMVLAAYGMGKGWR